MKPTFMILTVLLVLTASAPLLYSSLSGPDGADLTPGRYVAQITPPTDPQMSEKILEELSKVAEIEEIAVDAQDSVIRFTVRADAQVKPARISEALRRAAPDKVVISLRKETLRGSLR